MILANFIHRLIVITFYTECIRMVQGPRGGPQLVVRNFSFIKQTDAERKTYWRCHRYQKFNCRARCVTDKRDGSLVQYSEHTHKPDITRLQKYSVIRETIYAIK